MRKKGKKEKETANLFLRPPLQAFHLEEAVNGKHHSGTLNVEKRREEAEN